MSVLLGNDIVVSVLFECMRESATESAVQLTMLHMCRFPCVVRQESEQQADQEQEQEHEGEDDMYERGLALVEEEEEQRDDDDGSGPAAVRIHFLDSATYFYVP